VFCVYLRTEFIFLHIINVPVNVTDRNCVRYELNLDIQSVSFDRCPLHGSCHSIFPADAGFLCDQAALFGENIRHLLLTFKAYWLRHQTTGFTFKNFTFCHTVFMCFVFIWEQTATYSPYKLNWLVFKTEMKSVYSAVRTGSLNKVVCASSLER